MGVVLYVQSVYDLMMLMMGTFDGVNECELIVRSAAGKCTDVDVDALSRQPLTLCIHAFYGETHTQWSSDQIITPDRAIIR